MGIMEPPVLAVKRLHEDALLPRYAYHDDSGADLYAPYDIDIAPGQCIDVPLGFAIELPSLSFPFLVEGQIRPRSGLSLRTSVRMPNSPGTIDNGYRGNITVLLENTGKSTISFQRGHKIGQLVICPILHCRICEVETLTTSIRGTNGLGSTGI